MDPWYCFAIEFNYNEDDDFNPRQICEVSSTGDWVVDYLDNDKCEIIYNCKTYKKVIFNNETKQFFFHKNEYDCDIYVLELELE